MSKTVVDKPTNINGIRVVQDENEVLEALKKGEVICRFEWGDSMHPILKNGEYAKLIPIDDLSKIKRGDAVFCKITDEESGKPYYMTHMVWEISTSSHDGDKKPWFKIGSSMTTIFGWTQDVYAIALGMNVFETFDNLYIENLNQEPPSSSDDDEDVDFDNFDREN